VTDRTHRLALVFPADPGERGRTRLETSRHAETGAALAAAGLDVVGAPFAHDFVPEFEARLAGADAILVWCNPIEAGRDRSVLNGLLRTAAKNGAMVSAHPDVIDKIGTKDVLHLTRNMGWGCDTRRYDGAGALRAGLAESLKLGPRVLKRMRGQSGEGVWKVERAADGALLVRHAKRGEREERMSLDEFVAMCGGYFAADGAMIDQPYQDRLREGMIRCYVVGGKVQGFGEQAINALHPDGVPPGPRHYFPPDRADFQLLKRLLENEWIPEMCRLLGLDAADLPVLWDADFLRGPPRDGADTYVLCEINASSVYPYPPSALGPLVTETRARLRRRKPG
jgi:hypothetical protein